MNCGLRGGYYSSGARRRRRNRRNGRSAGSILKNTLLAAAAASVLSLLLVSAGFGQREQEIRLRYADEHPSEKPEETHCSYHRDEELPTSTAADGYGAVTAEYGLDSPIVYLSLNGVLRPMDIEEYLVGVVAAEMPVSAGPEALKAQAVAARTFTALHMAGGARCGRGAAGCTVCSDPSCCQAYKTDEELRSFWGADYDANIAKIREAVYATRGVAVTYNGRLISALYHASSGPATENSEAVFAVALPYLVSVDSLEGEAEAVSVQEFSGEELADIINAAYPDARLSPDIKDGDIDVWGRTESGRVQLVQTGSTVLTGQQLRELLGLKSTDFTVEAQNGMVRFKCIGYGHGVGMSQYGAIVMASNGYKYDEILLHYYTGTQLAVIKYG